MSSGSRSNSSASSGGPEPIGESGVRVTYSQETHLAVRKGVFYAMAVTCVVVILCFLFVTVSVTQSIFSFIARQDCITELRINRDSAFHERASADSRRDRAVDEIIRSSARSQDIRPGLITELETASDEVQRKEEVLDQRNNDFAGYRAKCDSTS